MESRQVFLLLFLMLNGMYFGILSVSAGMTLDQVPSLERKNTAFDRPWTTSRAVVPTVYGLQNGCPRVQTFYPRIGYPGTKVVITGQNLGGVTEAKFATNASAKIERVNDTEIYAIVPPGAESGPIQITKPGCSNVVLNSFTVPPQPKITLSPALQVANVNGSAVINVKFGFGLIAPTILSISSSQPASVSVPSLIIVPPGASEAAIKASVLSNGPPAEITVTLPINMGGGSARAVITSGSGSLIISNVTATNITPISALITWNTNLYCDGIVEYGISSVYSNLTSWRSTYVTSHLVTITGLLTDKTYNYRVRSRDIAGNLVTSGNFTFKTTPSPTPNPSPTPTPKPSATPMPTPKPSATPMPTPRPSPTPTPAPAPMPSGTAFLEGIRSFTGAQFVEWTGIVDASMSNGLLMKTAGCDGCEATAYSKQAIYKGDGFFEVVATETNLGRVFGLMTATKKVSAAALDFSINLGSNTAEVRELGVSRFKTDFRPGDVFRVMIEGGKIKYSKNYIVFYQSGGTPTYPMVGAVAFRSIKSSIGRSRIASLATVK